MSTEFTKYGIITFLLALIAGATFYMAYLSNQASATLNKNSQSLEIDSILYGIRSTRFNNQGNIQSVFSAAKLIHYKKTNDTQFVKPKIILYSQTQDTKTPWVITAHSGKSFKGSHEILLQDHVKIHQNATSQHGDLTIITSQLTYYPDKQLASTDAVIYLQQPGLTIKGRGLRAELADEHIQLLHEAQGNYEPMASH